MPGSRFFNKIFIRVVSEFFQFPLDYFPVQLYHAKKARKIALMHNTVKQKSFSPKI